MPFVSLAQAEAPLVLALDLGTSSFRALAFDREARAIMSSEEQIPHEVRATADGGAEADPDVLFDLLVRCIDGALLKLGTRAADVAAVGCTSFWHSLMGLDAAGQPTTPVFIWSDTRSRQHADALRRELDREEIHQRTGCFIHSSYWPAKLHWIKHEHTGAWARTTHWYSFTEYATSRLMDDPRCSLSMASGTGLLAVHERRWDAELLGYFGFTSETLPELTDRDVPLAPLRPEWASRWPSLAGVPWFPSIGDGAAANVGSSAAQPGRIALTLGTSGAMRMVLKANDVPVPDELWAYRLDAERYVLGGALSNGGNVLQWLSELLGTDFGDLAHDEAARLAPDSHGLTMLPFIAGERSPTWNDHTHGVIAGMTLATTKAHVIRAAMEAVAYRFARLAVHLLPLAGEQPTIVANGGAILNSPLWLQITTDVLGQPVVALPAEEEASAAGAAIVALCGIGTLPAIEAAPDRATSADVTTYTPIPANTAIYAEGIQRQRTLENLLFPDLRSWLLQDPAPVPTPPPASAPRPQ